MPVAADDARLAASAGDDTKRLLAREAVAREFFRAHLFELEGDWDVVRRALQCIDYREPVVAGPMPSCPKRLLTLPVGNALGAGFFALHPAEGPNAAPGRGQEYWVIAPEAPYLRWSSVSTAERAGETRFYVPAARTSKGAGLASKERG